MEHGGADGRSRALRGGLRLRLRARGDFEAAFTALQREAGRGVALAGAAVTLETGGRRLGAPEIRRIEQLLLDRHGVQVLQVVEGASRAQRAAGGASGPSDRNAVGVERRAQGRGGAGAGTMTAPRPLPRIRGHRPALRLAVARPAAGPGPTPSPPAARPTHRVEPSVAQRPETVARSAGGHDAGPPPAPVEEPHAAAAAQVAAAAAAPAPAVQGRSDAARFSAPFSAGGVVADDVPTMLIRRTMRSGQRVRFGGHVVVLGDVNPGAEIVAAGDIVVMGTLRGVAHAGAAGDQTAVIVAFRLLPTQIRIAVVIGRSPDGRGQRPDGPEVARVRDGALVVERYVPQA